MSCREIPSAEVDEKLRSGRKGSNVRHVHSLFRQGVLVLVLTQFRWWGTMILLLGALVSARPGAAQELSCRVQIDRSQLSGSEFSFLDDLERRIREYMNTQNWTDDRFLAHEKIACDMQIIIRESVSLTEFRARLIVTSRRPIHETAQSTVVVRISDPEWQFEYGRGTSLNFDLQQYNSLTSVLDFYAYVILGYDYDTFSKLGGTPYFETARRIANRADGNGDPGWSVVGGQQNRRQLINDLLTQRHRPLRTLYYKYHLQGLDRFVKNPEKAREVMFDVVQKLQKLNRNLSGSYPLNLFFSTKYQELAAIFKEGDLQDRAYNLLTQIDPSHSSEYERIVQ